ncbi:uncharacterized protein BDZ83DRAFT_190317 [Colletotrichum acutatum]|uniref:Uncharacterized protein n=1 Tax=Glomerella acutata TaxID=27357 RepID=A0AAD8U9U2_GLOAC|nr:uncharacterized protein BDZ83DRAFT_190317 [Colletotrichum acutatum]KAK1706786.1 hypothetical protein BDZ83DRAFT_190317 [Colletotrichum acutatum]
MCKYEKFIFPVCCGHIEERLNSYCHFSRTDPDHYCGEKSKPRTYINGGPWPQEGPCNSCISTATQEQMEAWAPDPVKRDKFIFQFHLDMLEAAREPWRRAQRAHFIRVKDDNAWVYRQLRKNWKNEMAAAQKAAEEGDIRTPTQEDFMEVDRAGSSSQGGNASGK